MASLSHETFQASNVSAPLLPDARAPRFIFLQEQFKVLGILCIGLLRKSEEDGTIIAQSPSPLLGESKGADRVLQLKGWRGQSPKAADSLLDEPGRLCPLLIPRNKRSEQKFFP